MPTPTPELFDQLEHLPAVVQADWLSRWAAAILNGEEPPPLPVQEQSQPDCNG